jgi:hypothetical protein
LAAPSSGFVATVRAEVRALDASPGALRRFGWVVGGVFALLGAALAWRAGGVTPVAGTLLAVGLALVAGGTVAPSALAGPFRAWMTLAMAMGFVMTRVILTLAFVLVFVPVSLVFRVLGRDPLHRRPDPRAATYWVTRTEGPSAKERLERMW